MATKATTRQRFGFNLKAARVAIVGLSQEKLAHQIGVTVNTVARWERGEREPDTLAQVEVVARAVGKTVGELLE